MKWSKGWEPRFRLHIGFFHSLLGRRLMVAQRENKGRQKPRCIRLASASLRRSAHALVRGMQIDKITNEFIIFEKGL